MKVQLFPVLCGFAVGDLGLGGVDAVHTMKYAAGASRFSTITLRDSGMSPVTHESEDRKAKQRRERSQTLVFRLRQRLHAVSTLCRRLGTLARDNGATALELLATEFSGETAAGNRGRTTGGCLCEFLADMGTSATVLRTR